MHLIATFHALAVAGISVANLYVGADADFEHHLYTVMAGYFLADYFTYCIGHDPIIYGFRKLFFSAEKMHFEKIHRGVRILTVHVLDVRCIFFQLSKIFTPDSQN